MIISGSTKKAFDKIQHSIPIEALKLGIKGDLFMSSMNLCQFILNNISTCIFPFLSGKWSYIPQDSSLKPLNFLGPHRSVSLSRLSSSCTTLRWSYQVRPLIASKCKKIIRKEKEIASLKNFYQSKTKGQKVKLIWGFWVYTWLGTLTRSTTELMAITIFSLYITVVYIIFMGFQWSCQGFYNGQIKKTKYLEMPIQRKVSQNMENVLDKLTTYILCSFLFSKEVAFYSHPHV